MPSFFNIKYDAFKEHLIGFQESFTDEQKQAILFSLFDIANSDDEFHAKEIEFFDQIGKLLDYPTGENILNEYLNFNHFQFRSTSIFDEFQNGMKIKIDQK